MGIFNRKDDKSSMPPPKEKEMENSKSETKMENEKSETKNASPTTKAKSSPNVVNKPAVVPNTTQKQIAARLTSAVQNNPRQSGRSQDVVPLSRDCERLIEHLQEFIVAARAYQGSIVDLEHHRTNLFRKTETLSRDTNLPELADSKASDMETTLHSLQSKIKLGVQKHAKIYEKSIIDYATEWKSTLTRKMEGELSNVHQLHQTVQHYEVKVEKLRKHISEKDKKSDKSASPGQKEKLERNEEKLAKAWEEYDAAATRAANLLEEATKMGWNDFHPLARAMIAFEHERGKDEKDIWDCIGTIQDEFTAPVSNDNPTQSPLKKSVEDKNNSPPIHALEDDFDSTEQTELVENSSDHDENHESAKMEV